jgi:hypothetical protein
VSVDADAAVIDAWLLEQPGDGGTAITREVIECSLTPVAGGPADTAFVESALQCPARELHGENQDAHRLGRQTREEERPLEASRRL